MGQRTAHVCFECKQGIGPHLGDLGLKEKSGIVHRDLSRTDRRIPAELRPEIFVEVIVDAIRIGQKTVGKGVVHLVDLRVIDWPWVNTFSPKCQAECRVEPGDGILTADHMRDVGIPA